MDNQFDRVLEETIGLVVIPVDGRNSKQPPGMFLKPCI